MSSMETALTNFRARVEHFHVLNSGLASLERRIGDVHLHLHRITADRDRLEPTVRHPQASVAADAKRRREQLSAEVCRLDAEIAHLEAERVRLQQRRDVANSIACRCRDYLRERGMLTPELEF